MYVTLLVHFLNLVYAQTSCIIIMMFYQNLFAGKLDIIKSKYGRDYDLKVCDARFFTQLEYGLRLIRVWVISFTLTN